MIASIRAAVRRSPMRLSADPEAFGLYRRLARFAIPYRSRLVVAAVLLFASTALALAWPQVVQRIVDRGFEDPAFLDVLVLTMFLLLVLRAFMDGVRQYLTTYAGERVMFDLRIRIVRHMQSLSLSFFSSAKTGELISHVTSDATLVHGVITQTVLQVAGLLLTLLGGLTLIFVINWRLALLALVVAPPIALISQWLGRRIRVLSRSTQDALADAVGVLQESVAEVRIVQAFAREEYEARRFTEKLTVMFARGMQRARIASVMFPAVGLLAFTSSLVVLWYGGHQVASGQLTAGQLVSFLLYLAMVVGPIGGLAGQWTQVQSALGAAERIFALLDTVPDVSDAPDALILPPSRGEITFESVHFRYGPGPAVLDGVTLTFRSGETTALVGPSGAGKTTLLNLVARFYDPTEGSVSIDGHDLRRVTLGSLRSKIAIVPQEPVLFAISLRENIRYGRLDASDAEIEAVAKAANAMEFIERLPNALDTVAGERGARLSVGQRQRIAIARALLRHAPILLLDEATSSLDNESEFLVRQALDRLMAGRTTIVIAHRLTTVERSDRIVVLERGRIVEQGLHTELLSREGLYRRLYTFGFAPDASPGDLGMPGST